ncbi:hypothetical protein [Agathobacter ruminis]|uniref:Uncharacterized protein n=1 Tax=Agathobacter ruminis TaxID=1712665 RepID=A0A2G3E4C8_9FIRM|nr:hypothetical protein [Agathobacter ruminis]MDC7301788.1 hypothetical protein [Agathobacter ruminis]PHU38005.1 hypothetical protein CSX02_04820 [Agathobacter ruminis]
MKKKIKKIWILIILLSIYYVLSNFWALLPDLDLNKTLRLQDCVCLYEKYGANISGEEIDLFAQDIKELKKKLEPAFQRDEYMHLYGIESFDEWQAFCVWENEWVLVEEEDLSPELQEKKQEMEEDGVWEDAVKKVRVISDFKFRLSDQEQEYWDKLDHLLWYQDLIDNQGYAPTCSGYYETYFKKDTLWYWALFAFISGLLAYEYLFKEKSKKKYLMINSILIISSWLAYILAFTYLKVWMFWESRIEVLEDMDLPLGWTLLGTRSFPFLFMLIGFGLWKGRKGEN